MDGKEFLLADDLLVAAHLAAVGPTALLGPSSRHLLFDQDFTFFNGIFSIRLVEAVVFSCG